MLQRLTESDDATAGQADGNTADTSEAPKKRGRPRGSRSKTSRESREVLAQYGPKVFERICRIALGRPVYTEPDADGRRTKRYPTEAAEMAAQKIVAERLIPQLKATELTGADGEPLYPVNEEPIQPRELAKAILSTLATAVPGGKVNVEEPGTFTAKFRDDGLGRKLLPGDAMALADADDAGREQDLQFGPPSAAEGGYVPGMTVRELPADDEGEAKDDAAAEPDRLHAFNGSRSALTLVRHEAGRGRYRVFDTRSDTLLRIVPSLAAAKEYATGLIGEGKFGEPGEVRFEAAPLPAMPGGEVRREQRKDMPRPTQTTYKRGHARAART